MQLLRIRLELQATHPREPSRRPRIWPASMKPHQQRAGYVRVVMLFTMFLGPFFGYALLEGAGRALAPYELMPWESGTHYLFDHYWR
jgi:hypothetical protein